MSVSCCRPRPSVELHHGNNDNAPIDIDGDEAIAAEPTKCKKCSAKVVKIVKIIFLAIAAITLMVIQPFLFFAGVIGGVVINETMRQMIEKIKAVWTRQPLATFGLGAVMSIFALPVVILSSSFFMGGYLGTKYYKAMRS